MNSQNVLFQRPALSQKPKLRIMKSQKEEELEWTPLMLEAKKFLPYSMIQKFKGYPDELLIEEIEAEIKYPSDDKILKDIYSSLREGDLKKYLTATSKARDTGFVIDEFDIQKRLIDSLSKQAEKRPFTKHEFKLLSLLNKQDEKGKLIRTSLFFVAYNMSQKE